MDTDAVIAVIEILEMVAHVEDVVVAPVVRQLQQQLLLYYIIVITKLNNISVP